MERFEITLPSLPVNALQQSALCGVVSSGNLEVMIEANSTPETCHFEVNTSADGFQDIWRAVLADFSERHKVGGLNISINDAGATPAVVSLRLTQAYEESQEGSDA
jgi:malonate decarboxylase delta subunit